MKGDAVDTLMAIAREYADPGTVVQCVLNSHLMDLSDDDLAIRQAIDERLAVEHDDETFRKRYARTCREAERRLAKAGR